MCKGVVWFCYGSFMQTGANIENVLFKNRTKKQRLLYAGVLQCVNIGLDECNCRNQVLARGNIT